MFAKLGVVWEPGSGQEAFLPEVSSPFSDLHCQGYRNGLHWPAESISTGMALGWAVVTSRMLPIKQLLLTFSPLMPMLML